MHSSLEGSTEDMMSDKNKETAAEKYVETQTTSDSKPPGNTLLDFNPFKLQLDFADMTNYEFGAP